MTKEFTLRGFRTEVFELRDDGLISVGGRILPQSIAFSNIRVGDDGVVEKEAGENGTFRIKSPSGFFEASFRDGQWHVRSDIPEVIKKVEDAIRGGSEGLHSTANATPASPVNFPTPHPSSATPTPTLYGVMVMVVVIMIVLGLGYFTLEDPIGRVMSARAARQEARTNETEIRLLEARAKEEYRVLEKSVRSTRATAMDTIAALERSSKVLAAKVLASTKVSLSVLERNPDETPREIDQLLRKDESFLSAWNRVVNAHVSDTQLNEERARLNSIDAHDKASTLQDTHLLEVEKIVDTLQTSLDRIEGVERDLAIVQEKLASKRLQEKMSQETRSSP